MYQLIALVFVIMAFFHFSSDETTNEEIVIKRAQSWEKCLDVGGVPIPAWYNNKVLKDCKMPK